MVGGETAARAGSTVGGALCRALEPQPAIRAIRAISAAACPASFGTVRILGRSGRNSGYGIRVKVVDLRECDGAELFIEDISTGFFASGFGTLADGRPFAFHVHRGQLDLEIYRTRIVGPVPMPDDVVAVARRALTDVDIDDEQSLSAALRSAVAIAVPVGRQSR